MTVKTTYPSGVTELEAELGMESGVRMDTAFYSSAASMDRMNNNTKPPVISLPSPLTSLPSPLTSLPSPLTCLPSPRASPSSCQADLAHSRDLMAALCAANPQFTASVLEDYIRPVFRWQLVCV